MRSVFKFCFLCISLLAPAGKSPGSFIDYAFLKDLKTKYGEIASQRGEAIKRRIEGLQSKSTQEKLREVNRLFNQFKYRTDKKMWGKKDYWQTPVEFIGNRAGDCEDYVIAKYFALRSIGVDESKLYLTYVKAVKENVAHMVLSYFKTPSSIPLVLDNYNPRILPATKRTDLLPVYSFNAKSLFLAKSAGLGKALPTDKIRNSKWDRLLKRVQER